MFLFRELSQKNKNLVLVGGTVALGYFIYKCEFDLEWTFMNFQPSDREAQRQPRVVGKIDQLFIYPLKSAEGIPISSGYAAEQSWIQKY